MASIGSGGARPTGSLAGILIVLALSLGLAAKAAAHGGDATKIHACVKSNGEIRIVGPNDACGSNWSPLDWSITAPPPRIQPMDFPVNCNNAGETIQAALGKGLIPGDRLLVSGICNENVVVGEALNDITIEGQGTPDPEIRGPIATQDTVSIRGRRIFIRGFRITGGNSGINTLRGGTSTIDGNLIENTGQHGISVGQGSVATIVDNTIRSNPVHGIFISFGSANIGFRPGATTASPNFIQGNGQIGIGLGDSSSARIDGNTISDNGGFGINVAESSSARIGFTGILGSLTAANTIQGNRGGIRVANASNAGIEGNFIQSNQVFGILVDFSSSADIGVRQLVNRVENNAGVGIIVGHSSSARILAAQIRSNTGDGVQVIQASQADLNGNAIDANSLSGIKVEGNSGVNLSGNTGHNGQFGLTCRIGSYASGPIGLTGNFGQKDFGVSEDCIDRTFP